MSMFIKIKLQLGYLLALVLCWLGLLASTLIYNNLPPCPLCELQQIIAVIMGALLLLALIHNPRAYGMRVYAIILLVFSVLGILLTVHQLHLQNAVNIQGQACSLGMFYLLQTLPLKQALIAILHGAGDCTLSPWKFMQLSMAEWSLIFFIVLGVLTLWQLLRGYPDRLNRVFSR